MKSVIIFRNNLRIEDNPTLFHACKDSNVIPIYIYDKVNFKRDLGSASKYWLHHALKSLNKSLNNKLNFYCGDSVEILDSIIKSNEVDCIYLDEPFLEDDINLHRTISDAMSLNNVNVKTYNSSLLWEPNKILKDDGTAYKVFSPFYKKRCLLSFPNSPVGSINKTSFIKINKITIDDLDLLDNYPWHDKFEDKWNISESGAMDTFLSFLNNSIYEYKKGRDFPGINKNSKLSPYIRFGMISVHRIWEMLSLIENDENVIHFKSEIGWREFSYYLLHHFPYMENQNLQTKFDNFKWENDNDLFIAWTKGETGFPIIDAGMKELWNTGYMHNRVRMITASFLVKNLLIDWRLGEKWFWDCLFDADPASNVAGWQWTAGTGADAAPYFRIFNPMLQGNKFDGNGMYTKKYIPSLSEVPLKYLQNPHDSGLDLSYTKPIIDYRFSRERSLRRYNEIKQ